jgi:predicted nucleic acid-binding protein
VTLFVDSSAFYAASDRSEKHNVRAKVILEGDERLVTTDHVLVETCLLLQRRLGGRVSDGFWAAIREGVAIVELVGSADLEVAWSIGEAFPDQGFSIVDRTSFAVMQRLGVHRAASFDDDFAIFRFGRNRERAFELVR